MTKKPAKSDSTKLSRIAAWVLTVAGGIGLFASFMLSLEEIHLLKNPGTSLNCDLNPLIGCGSILETWQSHVFFGISNQLLGLVAFSVVITLGVLLLARVELPKWIWRGLQLGAAGGVVFVLWFMYQSLFVLNHLCPYCMVTWAVTLAVAWYVTVRNIANNNCLIIKPGKLASFLTKHHLDIFIAVFVAIVAIILVRFREFFFGG